MVENVQALTRPVVTIIFALVLSWGFIKGQVSGDAFLSVVAMIIAFWFKDRDTVKDAAAGKVADRVMEKLG